nr:hypothetical protein GCM10025732_36650 [Glycomyces mayteni]
MSPSPPAPITLASTSVTTTSGPAAEARSHLPSPAGAALEAASVGDGEGAGEAVVAATVDGPAVGSAPSAPPPPEPPPVMATAAPIAVAAMRPIALPPTMSTRRQSVMGGIRCAWMLARGEGLLIAGFVLQTAATAHARAAARVVESDPTDPGKRLAPRSARCAEMDGPVTVR